MTDKVFANFCAGSFEDLMAEGPMNYPLIDVIEAAYRIGMRDGKGRPAGKKSRKSRR